MNLKRITGICAMVVLTSAAAFAVGRNDVADAAMRGDKAAVRTLIQQHADVNAAQLDGATAIHCHLTSWYVKPEFRPYASIFYLRALEYKNVTYLNISARPKTWKIIEAQGFKRYSSGQVIALATEGDHEIKEAADHVIYIPEAPEELLPILEIVPLQLLGPLGVSSSVPPALPKQVQPIERSPRSTA